MFECALLELYFAQ